MWYTYKCQLGIYSLSSTIELLYLELMLERIELVQRVFLLHSVQCASQVGGCYLCVSTGDRLKDSIVDER